jgi:hypothetical protein
MKETISDPFYVEVKHLYKAKSGKSLKSVIFTGDKNIVIPDLQHTGN